MGHERAVSSINLSHKFCLFCRTSSKEETSKKFNDICIFFGGAGGWELGVGGVSKEMWAEVLITQIRILNIYVQIKGIYF